MVAWFGTNRSALATATSKQEFQHIYLVYLTVTFFERQEKTVGRRDEGDPGSRRANLCMECGVQLHEPLALDRGMPVFTHPHQWSN
jgi:hypothetical protein